MAFKFDLQRFGSKGSNVELSIPDEYWGELQHLMATGALQTGDLGGGLLGISSPQLQSLQQGYGDLSSAAQNREQFAMDATEDLGSSRWDLATITDDRYMGTIPEYRQNADEYSSAQKRLTGDLSDNLTSANRRFTQDLNGLGGATREANQNLLSYKDSNSDINNIVNLAQAATLPKDQQATDNYTQALYSLIGGNSEALEDATDEYNGYIGQNNSALRDATSDISGYKQQTTNALRTNKTELDAAKKQAGEDTTAANKKLNRIKEQNTNAGDYLHDLLTENTDVNNAALSRYAGRNGEIDRFMADNTGIAQDYSDRLGEYATYGDNATGAINNAYNGYINSGNQYTAGSVFDNYMSQLDNQMAGRQLAGSLGTAEARNNGSEYLANSDIQRYTGQGFSNTTTANSELDSLGSASRGTTREVNNDLEDYIGDTQIAWQTADTDLNEISGLGYDATDAANVALDEATENMGIAADNANSSLKSAADAVDESAQYTRGLLEDYANDAFSSRTATNENLTGIGNQSNNNAYSAADTSLSGLMSGTLPQGYQDAMTNAIASTVQRSMGTALNSLGQRGVLNSSVTNLAMNDISRNAADVTAQNYLNNISTIQGLTQNRFNDALATSGANATMTNQQLQNSQANIDRNTGLAQTQLGNSMNANQFGQSTIQQQYQNQSNNLQFGNQNAQQSLANANQNLDRQTNLQQTQFGNSMNELQFSRDVAQQNYTNDLLNQTFQSGTAQNVFGNNQTAINTGIKNSQARLGNSMNNLAWQQGVVLLTTDSTTLMRLLVKRLN